MAVGARNLIADKGFAPKKKAPAVMARPSPLAPLPSTPIPPNVGYVAAKPPPILNISNIAPVPVLPAPSGVVGAPTPAPAVAPFPPGEAVPATPGGPVDPGAGAPEGAAAGGLTSDMLDAALRAIEAQYGLTTEQLLSDESDIGRRYRLVYTELQRLGGQQRDTLQAGALDRGIVQSGIYADQAARLEGAIVEQTAAQQADEFAALGSIQSQQAALPAQQAAAEAAAAQQAAAAQLDIDLLRAANAGGF